MTEFTTESTAAVWSRYWRKGVAHSCCLDFGDSYEGAVAGFWTSQFEALPADSLVVDVGTGNGAIPRLAQRFARERGRSFRVHGIDAADIDPGIVEGDEGITYHPNTSMLALPFGDGSVDLLCSQFAIEYVPWQAVLGEIDRVCGGEGRIACIVHSRDSQVHATTVERIEGFDALFASGLFAHARDMARTLAVANTAEARAALKASPRAEQARNAFNAAASDMIAKIEAGQMPATLARVLEAVASVLRAAPKIGTEEALATLDAFDADLRDERYRLLHLRAAAVKPEGLEAMKESLRERGFGAAWSGPVDQDPATRYGWALTAGRRA